MIHEIKLFENSHYTGFFSADQADLLFEKYEEMAYDLAEQLDHDTVVLFAVYEYYPDKLSVYSADFMMKTLPYDLYARFAYSLMTTSRLFFMRGRKDIYES